MGIGRTHWLLTAAAVALIGAAGAAGCNLREPEVPPLAGPSEFATSLAITAVPDTLPEDGTSQAVITVLARDPNAQPIPNLQLRIDTMAFIDGALRIVDVGRLSAHAVTTNSSGRVTVTYTAPATPDPTIDNPSPVRIYVTPIGADFHGITARFVEIRLVPPTIILVPGAPIANFSFSPSQATVGQFVFFDASSSIDPDGFIVSYEWNWDDGDPIATGITQDHDFQTARTHFVKLTVTDNGGLKTSISKPVPVVSP